jgi:hypothetical protein
MAITQLTTDDLFSGWLTKLNQLATKIGDIGTINVASEDRDTAVEAINKIISNIGALADLDTIDKTSIKAAINELILGVSLISSAAFTIGTETANVIRVTVQLKDLAGEDITERVGNVLGYLSATQDYPSFVSDPSGGWAIVSNSGTLSQFISNRVAHFTSNVSGVFAVDITESGTKTFYLVLVLPNGKLISSNAITFAA